MAIGRLARLLVGAVVLGPVAAAGLFAACSAAEEREEVLSDSSYVEVMARLARVRSRFTTRDSLRADSARRSVLLEAGVDVEELARYAIRFGEDAAHMSEVWTAINRRVLVMDSLEQEQEAQDEREREEGLQTPDTLSSEADGE